MHEYSDTIRSRRAIHAHPWHFDIFSNSRISPKPQIAGVPITTQQNTQINQVNPNNQINQMNQNNQKNQKPQHQLTINYPVSIIGAVPARIATSESHKATSKNKPTYKRFFNWIYECFNEYFIETTLHGLKYVGHKELHVLERLYWLIAFLAGTGFAIYFIASIYSKFDTSPMVISFSPTMAFLTDIPFPAVTVCNVNLALKSKAMEIVSGDDLIYQAILKDLCNTQSKKKTKNATESTDNITGTIPPPPPNLWEIVEDFTIYVNQQCDDLVKVCKWNGEIKNCSELINSVLTDEGYCCAFNQLPLNMTVRGSVKDRGYFPDKILNWNAEDGYEDDESATFPYRGSGQGQDLGLTLVLDAQLDEYHCTSTNSIGFKLLLSAPNERPKIAEIGFLLAPGVESRITIWPDVKDATEGVRSINVEKRQCYFARERRLKYFLIYTEKNCRLECTANYTIEKCQCLPFYLPRISNEPLCDLSKEKCLDEAKRAMDRITKERRACRCLPSCHDISYRQDSMSSGTIEGKYDTVNMDMLGNVTTKYFSENMAIVHFYYESDKFPKQTKSEMYGFSEFLSNTGGLLGLFLGFSFLSAMEILYFLVFRGPCRYYRAYNAKKVKERENADKRWVKLPYVQ